VANRTKLARPPPPSRSPQVDCLSVLYCWVWLTAGKHRGRVELREEKEKRNMEI
jgi:anti-sigma factor ChrR (cupin superfamily)